MVSWSSLNQPVNLVGGKLQVDDQSANQFQKRFYRVQQN
jgi:hypothetical protein